MNFRNLGLSAGCCIILGIAAAAPAGAPSAQASSSLTPSQTAINVVARDIAKPVPAPRKKPSARPAEAWHTNEQAIKLIEEAEGLRLHSYYLAGQWLVGYGHATEVQDADAAEIAITEQQADKLLKSDIASCEDAVRRAVAVPITRNQFSAMVAFCYNTGTGTFVNSRILADVNAGKAEAAANAFLLYDNAMIDNQMRELRPLARRRHRERDLFLAES